MNIIYDNIIYSLQKAGGISNYWRELTSRMVGNTDLSIQMIESSKALQNLFRSQQLIPKDILKVDRNSGYLERYLPVSLPRKTSPAIFHSSYYRLPLRKKNIAVVTTLHDFIYEYHVHGFRKTVHSLQKKHALFNSDGIICVSENTKADLLKFYPKCSSKQIRVIYNGVSDDFRPLTKSELRAIQSISSLGANNFALFIGDRAKYKNFDFAVSLVKKRAGTDLVIVGGKALTDGEQLLLNNHLPNRYCHLRQIDNTILNTLYNKAQYLIYPSSYEGFGIPVIEAMKAGCPVIALRASAIAEIANSYPLLEQLSIDLADRLIDQLETDRLNIVRQGFLISHKYTWQKCYEETVEFYRHLIQNYRN